MDLDRKLDELLAGVDMDSELDRRRAYIRVIEYADDQVPLEDYNLFLAKAADRLGQNRLMRDVLSMKLKADGKERIVIRFDEMEGCQIIASRCSQRLLPRLPRPFPGQIAWRTPALFLWGAAAVRRELSGGALQRG